jgi:hypothetical protein
MFLTELKETPASGPLAQDRLLVVEDPPEVQSATNVIVDATSGLSEAGFGIGALGQSAERKGLSETGMGDRNTDGVNEA